MENEKEEESYEASQELTKIISKIPEAPSNVKFVQEKPPKPRAPAKPRTEKQLETLKKGREALKAKKNKQLEDKKIREDEKIKELEQKIVQKAISIKKREIKQNANLDKIPDDNTPLKDLPIKKIIPQKPIFNFL
jgi:hypothetical protein